jgi:putative toxin-antitoxin system antitoxin component (TIGR02293 family)
MSNVKWDVNDVHLAERRKTVSTSKKTARTARGGAALRETRTGQLVSPATAGFQRTLGVSVKTRTGMIRKIRDGLSVQTFDRLAKAMQLNSNELAAATEIPISTLSRRKKAGRLQPDESDRLVRLATVFNRAIDLFEGDKARAAEWFRTPKKALNQASPLEYSDTEIGIQEVTDLIGRLEHGVFS